MTQTIILTLLYKFQSRVQSPFVVTHNLSTHNTGNSIVGASICIQCSFIHATSLVFLPHIISYGCSICIPNPSFNLTLLYLLLFLLDVISILNSSLYWSPSFSSTVWQLTRLLSDTLQELLLWAIERNFSVWSNRNFFDAI